MVRRLITSDQANALRDLAFALLPGMHTIIAGGFAISPQEANDVDLWVLGDPMLVRTGQVLNDYSVRFDSPSPDPRMFSESIANDEAEAHATLIIPTPLRDIHVVGTLHSSVQELLSSFDISTHRFAMTAAGVRVPGPEATFPWEDGRVLTYKFPKSTDARVAKLEARYGITIHPYQEPAARERGPKRKTKDAAA